MHATEHDQLGVGGGCLAGQPERVADEIGDVLDLGQLVVVGQDDRTPLGSECAHLVLERGNVFKEERCVCRSEHRQVHGNG